MADLARIARGTGRALAGLLSLDAVAAIVTRPARSAAAGAAALGHWSSLLVRTDRDPLALAEVDDDAQRFRLAAARLRLRPADLARASRAAWSRWATWLVVGTMVLAWALVAGRSLSWEALAATLVLAVVAGLQTVLAAVESWQLRTRSLGTFRAFLAAPDAWLPPTGDEARRRLASLFVVIACASILAPPAAWAATGSTTGTDMAGQILTALFPGGVAAGEGNGFSRALGALSAVLVGLGAGMLGFQLLSALVYVAHTGKAMSEGSRYHATWAPIRIVLGMGMLLPMPSGINGANMAVGLVAAWGSNQATTMWADYVEGVAMRGTTSATVAGLGLPVPVGGLDTARRVLAAETCAATVRGIGMQTTVTLPDTSGTRTGARMVWDYGVCGGFTVPMSGEAGTPAAVFSTARVTALAEMAQSIRASGWPEALAAGVLPNSGQAWPTGEITPALRPAADAYEATMKTAADAMAFSMTEAARRRLVERARADGWMAAGAYPRALAQMHEATLTLASETPTWRAPEVRPNWLTGGMWQPAGVQAARQAIERLTQQLANENRPALLSGEDLAAAGDANSDLVTQLVGGINKRVVESIVALARPNPSDPMGTIVSTGHGLVLAGQGGIAAGLGLAWATNTAPSKLLGGDGAWAWASRWAADAIGFTVVVGLFMSYVVPMTTFLAVIFAAVGWIVFLAEALVASTLLAFLFVRLDGQELVDSVQRPGLMLAFQFAFRPAFVILGLIASEYVLPVTMGLTSLWFPAAFTGQQGGHVIGLFGALTGLGLFAYLQYQVLVRTLAMVTTMPDRIPRWLGMAADGMGEAGDTDASRGKTLAILKSTTATTGRGITSGRGTGGPSKPVTKADKEAPAKKEDA